MILRSVYIIFLLLLAMAPQRCLADSSPRYITLAAGHVGVLDHGIEDPGVLKIEYRFRPGLVWSLAPAIGAAKSGNGASCVFADLARDFFPGAHWVVTPSFGIGSFADGEDVRLGNSIEFRSGIQLAYQFENHWRVGVALFHLSNGGISDRNPGTEPMFLSLSIPL